MIAVPTNANAPDRTIACYVINMARDVERRERMEVLLGGLGLDFLIVDAAVGASLTPNDLAIFEHRNAMRLLPAELGCMMSHINCWRAFLESGADLALVCEDDIHVSPHIRDCLAAIRFPEDGNVIVRLEGFGSFTTFRVNPIQRIADYGVHKMLSDHGGTAGYLIDKRAARHLLASAPKFRSAIDIEMFFPKRTTICDVNLYQFIPALVIQDQILTANQSAGFLQSHMGKERADVAIWNNRSVFQRLKGKARPFYQVLYSLYLRLFAGCMRIIVPFK